MHLPHCVMLLSSILLLATHALAGSHDDKVASLNLERAVSMTDEGRYEFEELSKKLEPQQKELKARSAEIEELKQRLTSQAPSTSDAERASLRSEIDAKQKLFEASSQAVTKSSQDQHNEITQRIATKMSPIIISVARKGKFIAIVDTSRGLEGDVTVPWPQGPLLWWASPEAQQKVASTKPETDMTDTIVSRYNSTHPHSKTSSSGSPGPP